MSEKKRAVNRRTTPNTKLNVPENSRRTPVGRVTTTSSSKGSSSKVQNKSNSIRSSSPIPSLGNSSLRRCFSTTMLNCSAIGPNTTNLKFKGNISTFNKPVCTVDHEIECTFAYNDYLQAIIKKQLLKKSKEESTEILIGQINYQKNILAKQNETRNKIAFDIVSLEEQNQLVELLDLLEEDLKLASEEFQYMDIGSVLNITKNKLKELCKKIQIKNIKAISNQADYDQLVEMINKSSVVSKKFLESGRQFKKTKELAEALKKCQDLMRECKELKESVLEIQKQSVCDILENSSDYYAKQYGQDV